MILSFRKFWFLVLLLSLVVIWGCAQNETQEKPRAYSMLDKENRAPKITGLTEEDIPFACSPDK
ncbi:MAG TPA: hypothetical protein DCK87_04770 [Desulfotomaculum sp.]|nr:hypothetical protein [Desulfotomaculum sp.]